MISLVHPTIDDISRPLRDLSFARGTMLNGKFNIMKRPEYIRSRQVPAVMSTRCGNSSADPLSTYHSVQCIQHPTTPVHETVQKCTQSRACEICGRVTAIGSSPHALSTHRTARGSGRLAFRTHFALPNPGITRGPCQLHLQFLMIPNPSLVQSLQAPPPDLPIPSPTRSNTRSAW